ncbi:MAG: hypothetical protein BJ554DRAFT_2640, partial [Olpidium bornovanus]
RPTTKGAAAGGALPRQNPRPERKDGKSQKGRETMVAGAAEAAIASVRVYWDVAEDWKADNTRRGLRTKLEVGGLCLVVVAVSGVCQRMRCSVFSVSGRDHVLEPVRCLVTSWGTRRRGLLAEGPGAVCFSLRYYRVGSVEGVRPGRGDVRRTESAFCGMPQVAASTGASRFPDAPRKRHRAWGVGGAPGRSRRPSVHSRNLLRVAGRSESVVPAGQSGRHSGDEVSACLLCLGPTGPARVTEGSRMPSSQSAGVPSAAFAAAAASHLLDRLCVDAVLCAPPPFSGRCRRFPAAAAVFQLAATASAPPSPPQAIFQIASALRPFAAAALGCSRRSAAALRRCAQPLGSAAAAARICAPAAAPPQPPLSRCA